MAKDASDPSRLVKFRGKSMYAIIVVERVHRPFAADEQNRVVVADLNLGNRLGILNQRQMLGREGSTVGIYTVGGGGRTAVREGA